MTSIQRRPEELREAIRAFRRDVEPLQREVTRILVLAQPLFVAHSGHDGQFTHFERVDDGLTEGARMAVELLRRQIHATGVMYGLVEGAAP